VISQTDIAVARAEMLAANFRVSALTKAGASIPRLCHADMKFLNYKGVYDATMDLYNKERAKLASNG
jgi:hypothetical protein